MPLIKINYKQVHYRDTGPANKEETRETLLLVHGLGSTQNYYTAVTPTLVKQGYRCIAVDTTGSGRSPYTFVEQSVASLAQDMIDLLDALGIDKAALVAHSMGGITGPQAAATFPDRITALVLLGPVYPSAEVAPIFQQRIETVEKNGMEAMAETIPFAAIGSKSNALHSAFIRELLLSIEPVAYISLCRVIADAYKTVPAYKKITCPVLIVAGEEDKSAPLAGCQRLLDAIGSSEKGMTVMKGIGHWMAVEAAHDVADEIVKFFKQIQQ